MTTALPNAERHGQVSQSATPARGLQRGVLTPFETLAQSIAGIAPSATPGLLIPIVFGFAGNGTWLSYLLGTIGVLFAAQCINEFASRKVCPGSLYTFVGNEYGRRAGIMTGWALLFAYVLCGSACVTQFAIFTMSLAKSLLNLQLPSQCVMLVSALLIGYCTFKNIKVSARLMLWLEFTAIGLITLLISLALAKHGLKVDHEQFQVASMNLDSIRTGIVMAIFSFVGFESAASLGTEAKTPLKSVPRAIMRSVVISGAFFVLASYALVMCFRNSGVSLDKCSTPLLAMADMLGLPALGHALDAAIMLSFFAAGCAVLNAAARILYKMSGDGLFHKSLADTHERNHTPHIAVAFTLSSSLSIALTLAALGSPLLDIVGWLGTLATFGFIYGYAATSLAAGRMLKRSNELTPVKISIVSASVIVLLLATVGSLYPVPPFPYSILPVIFAAYMLIGAFLYRNHPNTEPAAVSG